MNPYCWAQGLLGLQTYLILLPHADIGTFFLQNLHIVDMSNQLSDIECKLASLGRTASY